MVRQLKFYLTFVLIGLLGACDSDNDNDPPNQPTETLYEIAAGSNDFDTLTAALEASGLDATLDDPDGEFTVFAPTDAAFELLGEETINSLLADPDTLSSILLYHVIAGTEIVATQAIAAAGTKLETANGASLGLSLDGPDLLVNLATVTSTDIIGVNGVIHVIDAVLTPPGERGEPSESIVDIASGNENFSTLVTALQAAGLDDVLADENETFTVFAPTNAAFAMIDDETLAAILADTELLTALLGQHVVPGQEINSIAAYAANGTSVETASGVEIPVAITNKTLTIGGAQVVTADIYATNGVIHVIDTVIVADLDLPTPPMSIVEVAQAAGGFETLIGALQATGLDDTLNNMEGEFTVFAPTDAAFAALGDALSEISADTELLTDILLYHVFADGVVLADAATTIANGDSPLITMANGDQAALSINGEQLFVNLAQVTQANVMAGNGVIHVIDSVITPPAEMGMPINNIVETAISAGSFNTLVEAVQAANLVDTLADENANFTVFAPTDAAFAALGEETINALLADVPTLTEVLLNHVLPATVNSVAAFGASGGTVESAAELPLNIDIVDGTLQVEGATITTFDIYCSNGVIHVIDAVITSSLE